MIKMKTTQISKNPHMQDDSKWQADHFEIVLTNVPKEGNKPIKTFVTYYSLGIGHRNRLGISKPKLNQVLESLIMERDALEYSFEDWCANLGYDNDSIKAKNTYELCQKQTIEFKKFLGDDGFNKLISNLNEDSEVTEEILASL